MGTKINQLIKLWKPGSVFTSSFLKNQSIGYDQQLKYKNSGWLESLGTGAFKRADDIVDWPGALHALQSQLHLKAHLSGKSALKEHGISHFAYLDKASLYLNLSEHTKIPKWFKITCRETDLTISRTSFLKYDIPQSYTLKNIKGFDIRLSTPERAVLEMLYYVPEKQGFDEALKLVGFMTTLRPQLMQRLLEKCNSIKVNRLFLYMSDQHDHPWLNKINPDKINLGSGKRVIFKNGILDKKYQITVPGENFF